jgi:DNA-binding NarL/FixJ family response regulator
MQPLMSDIVRGVNYMPSTGVFVMNIHQPLGRDWAVADDRKFARSSVNAVDPARVARASTEIVAVSIVSNSRLLCDGVFTLLATRVQLNPIAHYDASSPMEGTLPNPAGHVVLIDSNIGYEMAQAWTQYWRMRVSPATVLVLEIANDTELIVDCIAAGVGGYILQGESVDELVQTITEVQQGVAKCSPEVTGRLFERLVAAHQIIGELSINESPLTPRELEVLHCVDQNLSNRQIAALLVIEERTVKHHVHNILEKFQLNSRREAALHAAKHGWLGTK